MTDSELAAAFLEAMRKAGLEPDCTIVADGELHRFRDWLDKPGTYAGWYILFSDSPPAGAFGHWRLGIDERWSLRGRALGDITKARSRAINKCLGDNHVRGQQEAIDIWRRAIPANGKHGYLLSKGVSAHGIRYLKPALIVPVQDLEGHIHGVQRIFRDGQKRFSRYTKKLGNFFVVGKPKGQLLYLAEGFATAGTIHELTGEATVVAFDASNLVHVALRLRQAYPQHELIICSDDDRHHEGNPGLTKAREAAEQTHAKVVVPKFSDPYSMGTDFNDLFLEEGADAVLAALSISRRT